MVAVAGKRRLAYLAFTCQRAGCIIVAHPLREALLETAGCENVAK